MNHWLLVLPVLLPLLTACIVALSYQSRKLTSILSSMGALLGLFVSVLLMLSVIDKGVQVTAFSSWKAPFGIVFVADQLSASLVFITAIIGVAISFYGAADLFSKKSYVLYHVLINVLLAGVMGSFLTGDIFNLYVFFEVMLIASFGLMILDANKKQIDSAVKYVVLNLISTMVFLFAIGLLYGATGTLNMADLHTKVVQMPDAIMVVVSGLFLFGFAIKASIFPVFAWLPASYHNLPSTVVALFAGLLTKVGLYAMIRVFTLVFDLKSTGYQPLLIWLAALTMLFGVLGAASQHSIKRILSFLIISGIGYMLMGLALYTPLALAGAIFYIIHDIIVKANLFFIGGFLERKYGSDKLSLLGGAYKSTPVLALLFLIAAFSLAGFPPLSGFWGKFLIIKASLQIEYYWLAATALFVSLMTIFSMTKIWAEVFWKPLPERVEAKPISRIEKMLYFTPIIMLALMTVVIGLAVEPLYQLVHSAAQNLMSPDLYIDAVLGDHSPLFDASLSSMEGEKL